jgi:DNA-binding LacI/PurR family transcriptional regulator
VIEKARFSTVAADGRQGVNDAVRYLREKGHGRIAYIGFPAQRVVGQERLQGYLDGMNQAGSPVRGEWIIEGDTQTSGGYSCTQRFLALPDRPTAVVAANDMMAIGAMRAAKGAGLSIPGDLAVVGFDNIALSELVDPSLTTVAQPTEEMGVEAANLVLRKIASPASRVRHMVLQTRLVIRDSA